MTRAWRALRAAAVVAACQGRDTPPAVHVADSAGVTIVTSGAADRPLAWSVRPELRLGGADVGPESFFRVSAALVAVDGRDNMTVADPMAARLHQFAADGTHRWSAGARGSGPGELELPVGISVTPDGGLAVHDARRRVVVGFDSGGRVTDEHRTPGFTPAVRRAGAAEVAERARYGDDGRVTTLVAMRGADTTTLLRTAPVRTSTARLEGCGPSPARVGPLMLSAELAWHVRDTLIAAAAGPAYAVDIFTPAGRLVRSIRRDVPARAATAADAERWAAEHPVVFTRGPGMECRIPAAEMVEKIGYADSLPAVGQVTLAPDGGLWVRRWSVTGRDGPIDVFDAAGAYVGTLPATFPFPIHVRADGRILYAERDALDVERLVVAEVERE